MNLDELRAQMHATAEQLRALPDHELIALLMGAQAERTKGAPKAAPRPTRQGAKNRIDRVLDILRESPKPMLAKEILTAIGDSKPVSAELTTLKTRGLVRHEEQRWSHV